MKRQFFNNWSFLESKLIFRQPPGEEPISASDQKILEEQGRKSLERGKSTAKSAAVQAGREKGRGSLHKTGVQPQFSDLPVTTSTGEKSASRLPEIPKQIKGLKVKNSDKVKINDDGTSEYPFQFGDNNIPGRIIMPANPKEGKKPVIVFNYVKDPDKIDPKLLKKMQENADLDNAIVVTIRTPSAETRVDGKKIKTMALLTSEIEKWQQESAKVNPKFKPLTIRAEQILHMADRDESQNVLDLLEKYKADPENTDPRYLQYPPFYNDPEKFTENLTAALTPPAPDEVPTTSPESPAAGAGGGMGGGAGGGGGMGGGGGSIGREGSGSSAAATEAETTVSPAGQSMETPATGGDMPGISPEVQGKGVNKLIILGDSLMVGAQGQLRANEKKTEAVGGKTVQEIAKKFSSMDLSSYKNETMIFNGGVNDIASFASLKMNGILGRTKEYQDFKTDSTQATSKYVQFCVSKIMASYKKIWEKAKENNNNITVLQCTAPPFLAANPGQYRELNPPDRPEIGRENEEIRTILNREIENAQKNKTGPDKVIPLHNGKSAGGLASDEDPSKMYQDYLGGDGLHLSFRGGKRNVEKAGYERMAEIIQGYLGEPVKAGSRPANTPDSAVTTVVAVDRTKKAPDAQVATSQTDAPATHNENGSEIMTTVPPALVRDLEGIARDSGVTATIQPQLVYMGRDQQNYQTMVAGKNLGGLKREGGYDPGRYTSLPKKIQQIARKMADTIRTYLGRKELPFYYGLEIEINGQKFRMPTAWHQHPNTAEERAKLAKNGVSEAGIAQLVKKHPGVEVWPGDIA